jgi:UDP-N-acetylmuramate: L-alanyl-gamma-D-glutamyl-meso-diaminopimelate ligase
MNVHFISIGGAVMHNMALALRQKGYIVSGSDDEIFEPALSRLSYSGILPESIGWFPKKFIPDWMLLFWVCMPGKTTPSC